ncbi:tetratricopeptide repeat protein [Devosia sp. BK]|uniref:tetratricopeptide repeat protein n=1 Tax=Devosia sp. BK TaxID=2871706 RepID=UPI00293AF44A|nr:tetratricopeptide repeat protein [Devosia sp. BK]MDV3251905.1 tetratricopeptide repeat protein [Devosia sp. BK]
MQRVVATNRTWRALLLAGVAALALSACASNRGQLGATDYSSLPAEQRQQTLAELTGRYKSNPRDRDTVILYAAALRAAGQPQQAAAALEQAIGLYPNDVELSVAYAKALVSMGSFEQSVAVIDRTLQPDAPDWNALLVKGAAFDQMGRNAEARALYAQAATVAPGEAAIEANMGLSYAMTSDLASAEQHLRRAVQMRGATSQTRQNLALVVGLQGRFDEARAIYAAELPPEQVEANMTYVRAMLTQQNRWDLIPNG